MRYTFLPEQEKKSLKREQRARLWIVACFMLSSVFMIGTVSLLPAYINASFEERKQLDVVARLKSDASAQKVSMAREELKKDSAALENISRSLSIKRPSEGIERIIALRKDNRITSFFFESPSTTTIAMTVEGVAPTRQALLSFKDRLEGVAPDSRVDLPISELAKGSDIRFSLRVTYSMP